MIRLVTNNQGPVSAVNWISTVGQIGKVRPLAYIQVMWTLNHVTRFSTVGEIWKICLLMRSLSPLIWISTVMQVVKFRLVECLRPDCVCQLRGSSFSMYSLLFFLCFSMDLSTSSFHRPWYPSGNLKDVINFSQLMN